MIIIRLRDGSLWDVKPGCDIIFIEFKPGDYRLQTISNISGKVIRFTASEIERIYIG